MDPLWTAPTEIAFAFEIAWVLGALGILLWLTRPAKRRSSDPETPLRRRARLRDEPPMAA